MTNRNSTDTRLPIGPSSVIRMTASYAERAFLTAEPILAVELTERHLDMLQMSDIDLATRAQLAAAADDLEAGQLHTPAVRAMVEAFNARCGVRS